MLRYLAGVISALLLVGAGVFLFRSSASTEAPPPPAPRSVNGAEAQAGQDDETPLPEASQRTREQKRFSRVDKDKSGQIAREEYLIGRRKAYAKLDTNGDGQLTFDEWAAKTTSKFAAADKDRSGSLTAAEFATTAVKRSPQARLRCPPQQAANESD